MIRRVHYPLMRHVKTSNFLEFEHLHCVRIEKIVAPAMLLAQLVRTNWIWTFAWSVRAVIAFALAWQKASVPIAGILLVAHLVCFTSMLPKAAGLLEESA